MAYHLKGSRCRNFSKVYTGYRQLRPILCVHKIFAMFGSFIFKSWKEISMSDPEMAY